MAILTEFFCVHCNLLPSISFHSLFLCVLSLPAPPENIAFSSRPLHDEERLLLAYKIEKVYPLPQVAIYQSCPETRIDSMKKILIHESGCCTKERTIHKTSSSRQYKEGINHFKNTNGLIQEVPFFTLQHVQYIDFSDVYLNYNKLNCEFVEGEEVSITFSLQITIPGTDFVVTKSIQFYPGKVLIHQFLFLRIELFFSNDPFFAFLYLILLGRPNYKSSHHERLVQEEGNVGSSSSRSRFRSLGGFSSIVLLLILSLIWNKFHSRNQLTEPVNS